MDHRVRRPIGRRSVIAVGVASVVGLLGSGAQGASAFPLQTVSAAGAPANSGSPSAPPAPQGPPIVAGVGQSTLSVTGNGVVEVAPDVASVSIGVRSAAATATGARSKANARTNAVLAAITQLGVDRAEIQTAGISLSRNQVPASRRHPSYRVYTATNDLTVTTRRISLVGPIVDAATRAGADSITGPDFTFGDPSAGKAAATRAALADARTRADDAAAAIGYRVIGVKSVAIDPASFSPQVAAGAVAPSATNVKAPTPTRVDPGRQEVDASVDVVYAIAAIG